MHANKRTSMEHLEMLANPRKIETWDGEDSYTRLTVKPSHSLLFLESNYHFLMIYNIHKFNKL